MYSIKIVRGNVVNVTTDAIVNSANNNLMPGGGSNKMIFYSAGDSLIEACSKIKYCETGKAVYTSGFNIPAKYIIHAVAPYWHGGYDNEARKLASTYISIMKVAEQLGIKSIGIPAIATGLGGYPLEEAIDIAVSSVVSYLQAHNLDMDVWFMCYDHETLLQYRAKNMDGVGDVSKYFERKEIRIDAKLNNDEKSKLKKKMFKKEISKEQELDAVNAVLKRIIGKKYPDHFYLPAPKKKSDITMKTCTKYNCTGGPFITMDCVEEYSYDKERIRIRVSPYSFTDTPQELESKKKYFADDVESGIPNEYDNEKKSSYNQQHKALKVLNIESMLGDIEEGKEFVVEYVDVNANVEIANMEDVKDELNSNNNSIEEEIFEKIDNTDLSNESYEIEDTNDDIGYELTEENNGENQDTTSDLNLDEETIELKEDSMVQETENEQPTVNESKKEKKDYHPNYKPDYKKYNKKKKHR